MYCCLSGLRGGSLDGCRPIIGLDGCFLKGLFKGQLLCAVGRDGNNNLYPIAWALVEVEKFDTWKWFLVLLIRDIVSAEEKGWAFLSDRKKGLIDVVHSVAPRAEHSFCVRHLYNNFKGRFKGEELKTLFWNAASTYSVKQHLRIMKQTERFHPKRGAQQTPYEWMSEILAQHWVTCFFTSRSKCEVVLNNISESFNNYILAARELPIIEMFECIRRKCMSRIQTKRQGMEKYQGVLCPNMEKKIEQQRVISRNRFATWGREDRFEVQHHMDNHVVYLNDCHCSCGMFQLVGYPCCHALSYIALMREEINDYVHDYFKKDAYLRVYNHGINPVPGVLVYEDSGLGVVDPPHFGIIPGRPKKVRRRDVSDTWG